MLLLVRIQQWDQKTAKSEPLFAQLMTNLHEQIKDSRVSFELVSERQHIYFYVHIPDELRELIEGQIYAIYPGAVIEEQFSDYASADAVKGGTLVSTELRPRRTDIYPWKRHDEFERDSLAGLFTVLSKAGEGQQLWSQITVEARQDNFGFNVRRT